MGADPKSAEWLLQVVTSAVFLVPGYAVVRFLQTTREHRSVDTLELTIQSLTFSLMIGFIWLYLTPPGMHLRHHVIIDDPLDLKKKLASFRTVISSVGWLSLVTVAVGGIFAYAHNKQLYWKALPWLGFDRLSPYITTWEEISDLSQGAWVTVETASGATYVGVISSVTPHPHEKALILRRTTDRPMQIIRGDEVAPIGANYVWISGDEIKSLGVFRNTGVIDTRISKVLSGA